MRTKKYIPMLFLFTILFSLLAMPIHADAAVKFKFTNIKISETNFPDKNIRAAIKEADKNHNGYLSWAEFHDEFYYYEGEYSSYSFLVFEEVKNTKGLELLPLDRVCLLKYSGGDIAGKYMTKNLESLCIRTVKEKGNYKISVPDLHILELEMYDKGWKYTEKNGIRITEATTPKTTAVYDVSGCKELYRLEAYKTNVKGMNQCSNLRSISFRAVPTKGKLDLSKLTKLESVCLYTEEKYTKSEIDGGLVLEVKNYPLEFTEIDISGTKKLDEVIVSYDYNGKKLNLVMNKKFKKYLKKDTNDEYEYLGISFNLDDEEGFYENVNMKYK